MLTDWPARSPIDPCPEVTQLILTEKCPISKEADNESAQDITNECVRPYY